jgi:hypothetical protein
MNIGEVASTAAGDQDLPSRLRIVLQQQNTPIPLPRNSRAHQPRRTRAQHNHVEFASFTRHISIVAERTGTKTIAWLRYLAEFIFCAIEST